MPKCLCSTVTRFITAVATVMDTKLFLKYLYLNAFDFTPIHKNKIKSKSIICLVWKMKTKRNAVKRWPLRVSGHDRCQPNAPAAQAHVVRALRGTAPQAPGDVLCSVKSTALLCLKRGREGKFHRSLLQTMPLVCSKQSYLDQAQKDTLRKEMMAILFHFMQDPC